MKLFFYVIAAGLFSISASKAQVVLPDWETVEIKTFDLGGGIYMLEGFGGNIGVSAGEDGVIIIDDQYAPLTGKVMAAIRRLSDKPIRFVLNTHWHPDHTGGNERLGKEGAVIIAHDKTRDFMTAAQLIDGLKEAFPDAAIPVATFSDTLTFHMNGETIRAFHVPNAHTAGDAVVHFQEADVIHTGDAYFNGFYPFIDVERGGSIDGMIAFYEDLIAMAGPQTKIIPGHGAVANRDNVRTYQEMLIDVRGRVAAAIEAGTSLEDLIAAEPLKDLDPVYGGNIIKAPDFLAMVFRELSE